MKCIHFFTKRRCLLISFLISLGFTGCTTLEIKSSPIAADIFAVNGTNLGEQRVGRTPLLLNSADLKKLFANGVTAFSLRKSGYLQETFLIPKWSFGEAKISSTLQSTSDKSFSQKMNLVIKLTLEAERLLSQKRISEVYLVCAKIRSIDESVAVADALEGAALFVEGKPHESKEALQRALEKDPEDTETKKFLNKIELESQRFDLPQSGKSQ